MKIEGGIAVGEASAYAARAGSRLNNHPWPMIISSVTTLSGMGVVLVVSSVLGELLDWPRWTFYPSLLLAAVIGIAAGRRACRAYALRVVRKALATRGLVDPVPNEFEILSDGLRSKTGRVETRAPWGAVSDVFPAGPYWVVLVDAWPLYMPKRFFASPDAEKAFLAGMLERMTPEAKARSADAARFVAS